jgi:hypothetical protein
MLVRRRQGSIFHIVSGETPDGHYFTCLCGMLVEKEDLEVQTVAQPPYSRCRRCRMSQNAQFKARYNRR